MTKPETQHFRNCLVVFAEYGLPFVPVTIRKRDRCFFAYAATFEERIRDLVREGKFVEWNHFIGDHGGRARVGFRENYVRCSLQIVFHGDPDNPDDDDPFIEADFDFWNPERGLGPMIFHSFEVLMNKIRRKKTNPFAIGRMIMKRREKKQREQRRRKNESANST